MGLRCVNCGSPANALFIQYSPGNIRLTKCTTCNAVADEYIESEMMILFIDLILHKPKAYRHLFFNLPYQNKLNIKVIVWKAALVFILLDVCRQLMLKPIKVDSELSGNPLPQLLVASGKLMINVFSSNLMFFCSLLLAVKSLQKRQSTREIRYTHIILAVLFSSYFKLFIIAMAVWDFPVSVVFILDVFVLSSNAVAVKVVTQATTLESMGISFVGHCTKLLINYMQVL